MGVIFSDYPCLHTDHFQKSTLVRHFEDTLVERRLLKGHYRYSCRCAVRISMMHGMIHPDVDRVSLLYQVS